VPPELDELRHEYVVVRRISATLFVLVEVWFPLGRVPNGSRAKFAILLRFSIPYVGYF
jgi:hypothetical protein